MSELHIPVLTEEVISSLQLDRGMVVIDATVGAGGHAEKILKKIGDSGYLIGIDKDAYALSHAERKLNLLGKNFKLFHADYKDLDEVLKIANIENVDGALFDLGASSIQLESASRGFSIKYDGPLDMRMDTENELRADDIINDYPKQELIDIFLKYGDEYFAKRIVDKIIYEREKHRIETTAELADIVKRALPYKYRFRRIHPATKVFMALRIAVNSEIESLKAALSKIADVLKNGARISVISFHSIEDRVVKNNFKYLSDKKIFRIINKKPIEAKSEEISINPRARSAKLRVAEKI